MGEQFAARGKRTDEMIDLMRALWKQGWTQFDGEFYPTPRLEMQPTPPPIPVYVGGLSEAALRRAARNDGWIGDLVNTDRAIEAVGRLRELRLENGLSLDDFTILTPLTDAFTTADYQRAADAGITGIITMPWMFYAGPGRHLGRQDRRDAAFPQGPRAWTARRAVSVNAILDACHSRCYSATANRGIMAYSTASRSPMRVSLLIRYAAPRCQPALLSLRRLARSRRDGRRAARENVPRDPGLPKLLAAVAAQQIWCHDIFRGT